MNHSPVTLKIIHQNSGVHGIMKNNILDTYGPDPIILFGEWFAEAKAKEINDPNAMAIATSDAGGRPSVRIVLMKNFDARGFTFYTNYQSQKGRELIENPRAEINFHWKSIERQIRISGTVAQTTQSEADEYFASRSRNSRLGACASDQSRPLESYETFTARIEAKKKEFEGRDVPRPAHWGGFRLIPESMEFWIAHPDRMHRRFIYKLKDKQWTPQWMYP